MVLFKALSDPIRLRLLSLIASHSGDEACVRSDWVPRRVRAHDLPSPQGATGGRPGDLRAAGLVGYYRAVPEALSGLSALLDATGVTPAGVSR